MEGSSVSPNNNLFVIRTNCISSETQLSGIHYSKFISFARQITLEKYKIAGIISLRRCTKHLIEGYYITKPQFLQYIPNQNVNKIKLKPQRWAEAPYLGSAHLPVCHHGRLLQSSVVPEEAQKTQNTVAAILGIKCPSTHTSLWLTPDAAGHQLLTQST